MQIAGHAAFVTGGGSGLGAATAEALVKAGARVALLDIDISRAEVTAARIGASAHHCDVADAALAEAAFAQAIAMLGTPRLLVNCAGIGPAARIVGREGPMPLVSFARVININLIGTFNLLRLAADTMSKVDALEEGERGVIVNTASIAAFEGQIGQVAYAASKGGVASLTLPAARELARYGIRVVTIAPGIFRTPMLEALPENVKASLGASVPFPQRLGEPGEYAALVLHILANRMLNGETIRLDGALRMAPR
ncbi:MAG: SDR family NAD(P)-dependent oxidoreductase [Acetobacteraceae bacterium]|nr:SDR family NAD(P)-dependent oxidoreductase [Acetobacteraceae bacterium]